MPHGTFHEVEAGDIPGYINVHGQFPGDFAERYPVKMNAADGEYLERDRSRLSRIQRNYRNVVAVRTDVEQDATIVN